MIVGSDFRRQLCTNQPMTEYYNFWKQNTHISPLSIVALLSTGFVQVIVLHLMTHNTSGTQMVVIAGGIMLVFLPFLAAYFSAGVAAYATAKLRTSLLQNFSTFKTNEIERIHAHTFSKAITQDVDLVFQFWKDLFGNICFNLPILLYLTFLLLLQSQILVIAGAVFILMILFWITYTINFRTRTKQREHHQNHLELQSRIQNYIHNIFQFRLYRNEQNYLETLGQDLTQFSNFTAQLSQHRQLYTTYISAILLLFFGGGLWVMRNSPAIKPSDVAILTILFIEIRRIVTEIFSFIHSYQKAQEVALHLKPWIRKDAYKKEPESLPDFFLSLHSAKLTFRYKESQLKLSYPAMEIKAGEKMWLKGSNGRGKSTFWKILTGLYTENQTTIWLNNIPRESDGVAPFLINIAAVTEPARSYTGRLWEIIGSFSAQRDDVVAWLSAHQLLQEFDNYSSQLDTYYDSGHQNLSAGQLKWLLIVQAFYASPDVLILDEPFSSLDSNRQQLTLALIRQLSSQTALILISHHDIHVSFDKIIDLDP
jgi:ATP-binding cassette subfamily C exporter for protease/lipase